MQLMYNRVFLGADNANVEVERYSKEDRDEDIYNTRSIKCCMEQAKQTEKLMRAKTYHMAGVNPSS